MCAVYAVGLLIIKHHGTNIGLMLDGAQVEICVAM